MDKSKSKKSQMNGDLLHKLILDINAKVDTNYYWLTTLLQNLIITIDALNAKCAKLDQRLTFIEGFTSSINYTRPKLKPSINRPSKSDLMPKITLKALMSHEFKSNVSHNETNDEENDSNTNKENGPFVIPKRRVTYADGIINDNYRCGDYDDDDDYASDFTINRKFSVQSIKNSNRLNIKRNRHSQPLTSGIHNFQSRNEIKNNIKSPSINNLKTQIPIAPRRKSHNILRASKSLSLDIKNHSNSTDETNGNLDRVKITRQSSVSDQAQEKSETDIEVKQLKTTDYKTKSRNNYEVYRASYQNIDEILNDSDTVQQPEKDFIEINNTAPKIIEESDIDSNCNNRLTLADKMDEVRNSRDDKRVLKKFKILKDGPFEFVLDVIHNELVVIEIFEGGIIHRHGGVKVGDILLAANGLKLSGKTFCEAQLRLEKAMEDQMEYIELTVARNANEDNEEITAL